MPIKTSPAQDSTAPARGRRTVLRAVAGTLSATALAAVVMVSNSGPAAAAGPTVASPPRVVSSPAPVSGVDLDLRRHPVRRMCWLCIG